MECGMNLHTRRPLKWTAAGLSIFPMSFGPMNLWPSFIERNFQTFWPKLLCEAGDFSWSAKLQFFSDVWRRSALVCLQKWQQRQTWCWMEIQPLLFLLQGIMLVDNPERPQRMVVWLRMKWVFCAYFIHGSGELQEAGLVETTQQKAPQVFDWPSEFDP